MGDSQAIITFVLLSLVGVLYYHATRSKAATTPPPPVAAPNDGSPSWSNEGRLIKYLLLIALAFAGAVVLIAVSARWIRPSGKVYRDSLSQTAAADLRCPVDQLSFAQVDQLGVKVRGCDREQQYTVSFWRGRGSKPQWSHDNGCRGTIFFLIQYPC